MKRTGPGNRQELEKVGHRVARGIKPNRVRIAPNIDMSETTAYVSHVPAAPGQLSARSWSRVLKETVGRAKGHRTTILAGSLAYNWFLALFPALIALLGVVSLLHVSKHTIDTLVHGATKALPSGAAGVITQALSQAQRHSGGALVTVVVSAAVAVWAASSGMATLEAGLDIAYEVPEERKFVPNRAVAVGLMLATAVVGGAAAALIVFAAPLGSLVKDWAPVHGTAFTIGWTAFRWVLAAILITVLFSLIYSVGPNRHQAKWQWVSVGGLVAAGVWVAASLGFSYYVSGFGSYSKEYGALAGVVILVLWLYITGVAILFGAELNASLEAQGLSHTRVSSPESAS